MWQVEGLCGSSSGRKPGAGWTRSWEERVGMKVVRGGGKWQKEKRERHQGRDGWRKKQEENDVVDMGRGRWYNASLRE